MWTLLIAAALAEPVDGALFVPSLTDAPSDAVPEAGNASPPWVQRHPEGRLAATWRLVWAPTWTVARGGDRAQALVETPEVTLSAGDWRVWVQLWHRAPPGAHLLTARVHGPDGLTTTAIAAERFDGAAFGGLQPGVVPFHVGAEGPVRIELVADGDAQVFVGTVQVAPASPRPIYVIEHCANTIGRVEAAIADGANAVELDLQWGDAGVFVRHPCPSPPACGSAGTAADALPALFQRLGAALGSGELDLVVLDVKRPHLHTAAYAAAVASLLATAGLPPDQVVMSVPTAVHGAPAAAPWMAAVAPPGGGSQPHLDAWHDVANGAPASDWLDAALAQGSDFLGLGADPIAVHAPMPVWADRLAASVNRRDRAGAPARVYFWTLERRIAMRYVLDVGVDAVIVNAPRRMMDVLAAEPYARWFKLAEGGITDR